MTYASLILQLKQLFPDTYDTAVPRGLTRYIAVHRYGAESQQADDANVFDFPRVQLDLYTQQQDDALLAYVTALLSLWHVPYAIVDEIYDDELALFRRILQLEVLA